MAERTLTATRITFLELKDERRMVQEGYALLDEKRMLLASEILARLRRYRALREEWLATLEAARAAMRAGVRRHGMDGLTVYPATAAAPGLFESRPERLLGLHLVEADLTEAPLDSEFTPAEPSLEAPACAARFRELAALATRMAALSASLRVLARDYTRTERRARALENVLLPEIESDLVRVDSQLEAIDQEESIRVREARARA
jgi:V/A-type H+/Na+-transporting ATPase subunit D